MPRFNSPVRIFVHSYRHRLADAGGLSAKAVIDALVHTRILADDSTKEIEEPIRFKQTKIPKTEEEKTEITIKEV